MADGSSKSAIITAIATVTAALITGYFAYSTKTTAPGKSTEPTTSSVKKRSTDLLQTPWHGWQFWQEGEQSDLLAVDLRTTRVLLKKAPFQIRMPDYPEDVAVQICVWKDNSIFGKISSYSSITDVPFYQDGTVVADTERGSGTLFLSAEEHNYFHAPRRISIGNSQQAVQISSFWSGGNELSLSTRNLYLVAFVNENGDEVVGNSEYEFLVLDFSGN